MNNIWRRTSALFCVHRKRALPHTHAQRGARCTHALMYPRKPDAALAPSCAVYAISRYVSAATTTGYPSRSKLRNQLPRIQVRRISKTPTSIPRKLHSREDLVRAIPLEVLIAKRAYFERSKVRFPSDWRFVDAGEIRTEFGYDWITGIHSARNGRRESFIYISFFNRKIAWIFKNVPLWICKKNFQISLFYKLKMRLESLSTSRALSLENLEYNIEFWKFWLVLNLRENFWKFFLENKRFFPKWISHVNYKNE